MIAGTESRMDAPMSRSTLRLAIGAALLLAGCAGAPRGDTGTAAPEAAVAAEEPAPFDRERAASLLEAGGEAEAAGRTAAALDLYRDAALAWPEDAEAWRRLSAAAAAGGIAAERDAAAFMAERAALYPSDALYVQREIRRALDAWIAEQRATQGGDPVRLDYAQALSDFYGWRYAQRGTYQPLLPVLNVEWRDLPAVVLSLGGAVGYVGSVAVSGATTE